ncbi:MAG TPA: pilus assembly protein PilM [Thermoguttaceae bacterium]|nr:pilus assembly protein PilM [Thermoguttaceae bacterium]
MVGWIGKHRNSPIGVDIGSRSVKLLQFDGEQAAVLESARWDLPAKRPSDEARRDEQIVEAITQARQRRNFRGRNAVLGLGAEHLFVQNIRVAKASGRELDKIVQFEAAGRLPFSSDEAEIRYLEAADVRQGDAVRREVILLACRQQVIQRILALADAAGLTPVAIDIEPAALLRCYCKQFRRDDDQQRRVMFVNVGAATSTVVIARGNDAMFVKYLDVGGGHLDEAVARHLKMPLPDAAALRRHNGDRRADQRDPEVTRSINESIRPVLGHLIQELSLCLRYYSVTFRGQPLSKLVLGGGEANPTLCEWLEGRLDLSCELGNPLRTYETTLPPGRIGQWEIAAGLALRDMN